jgi:glycerol-3-phosphate O-acyltransferase/dihydroxyacetone phosphate acyltransferase
MLWHLLKLYMSVVVAVYFKRTKVKNLEYLKVKGPAILALNHPNSFADPVAFSSIVYPPRVRYLARGDAFKKGLATWFLQQLGIIPIFRIQDGGKEGLLKNDETYNIVNKLLRRNAKIIIFAEGLCIQERRLRPLKKGVPRMIFGAVTDFPELANLVVIPVGVNYSDPSQFRSTLFFNVGKPIKISDYLEAYKEAPAKTMNQFLLDLAPRMKELIVNINHHRNEKVIEHIEEIYKYAYFKKYKYCFSNLEHDFKFSTHVAETFNVAELSKPEQVTELAKQTTTYTKELEKHQLKDWLFNPAKQYLINYAHLIVRFLLIVAMIPIYIVGVLGNYLPYKLTAMLVRTKIKLVEFKASFFLGFGAVLFLLNYAFIYTITALCSNYWYGLFVVFIFVLAGRICIWLSPFRKKTIGIYRVLRLKSSQSALWEQLSAQRKEAIASYQSL